MKRYTGDRDQADTDTDFDPFEVIEDGSKNQREESDALLVIDGNEKDLQLLYAIDPHERYMREIFQYPLFSLDEEYEKAMAIFTLRKKIEKLKVLLNRSNGGKSRIQKSTLGTLEMKYARLRGEFAERNLRLVIFVARRIKNASHSTILFNDLVSEGNCGLLHAIDKFEPQRRCKFSTYAYPSILQRILRCIQNDRTDVRVPVHIQELSRKLKTIKKRLAMQLQRQPTEEEVAKEVGVKPERARDYLAIMGARYFHIDQPLPGVDDDNLFASVVDSALSPEQRIVRRDTRQRVIATIQILLDGLDERTQTVMKKRVGFCCDRQSLEEIGKHFNVTRERIRQLEKKGWERIRVHLCRLNQDRINGMITIPHVELLETLTKINPRRIQFTFRCIAHFLS